MGVFRSDGGLGYPLRKTVYMAMRMCSVATIYRLSEERAASFCRIECHSILQIEAGWLSEILVTI